MSPISAKFYFKKTLLSRSNFSLTLEKIKKSGNFKVHTWSLWYCRIRETGLRNVCIFNSDCFTMCLDTFLLVPKQLCVSNSWEVPMQWVLLMSDKISNGKYYLSGRRQENLKLTDTNVYRKSMKWSVIKHEV